MVFIVLICRTTIQEHSEQCKNIVNVVTRQERLTDTYGEVKLNRDQEQQQCTITMTRPTLMTMESFAT